MAEKKVAQSDADKKAAAKVAAADKKAIKALTEKDVPLEGTETSEELAALMAEHFPKAPSDSGDGEEIVLAGVPNSVPPVFEPLEPGADPRKAKRYGVFQVVAVKGGHALYNQRGQRVSTVCRADRVHGRDADIKDKQPGEISEFAYIAKACARNNAERRSRRLPGDPSEA